MNIEEARACILSVGQMRRGYCAKDPSVETGNFLDFFDAGRSEGHNIKDWELSPVTEKKSSTTHDERREPGRPPECKWSRPRQNGI